MEDTDQHIYGVEKKKMSSIPEKIAGTYDDWISNVTDDLEVENCLMCHECHSYIRHSQYWYINGEVLCDDCARAKYQRGNEGRFEVMSTTYSL